MDALQWIDANLGSGIIGGFIGAFFGGFAKFFWEKYLPDTLTWRRQQAQERRQVLATFRDPMLRAADDLQSRLWNVACKGGLTYLGAVGEANYGTGSTLYVLAQYFAWAEILRQRIRLLNYGGLSRSMDKVAGELADSVSGLQIFRLQQREIAERMIVASDADGALSVLTYGEFLDQIGGPSPSALVSSLAPAVRAIDALKDGTTAVERLRPIQHALIDLIDVIDDPRMPWIDAGRRTKACPMIRP